MSYSNIQALLVNSYVIEWLTDYSEG